MQKKVDMATLASFMPEPPMEVTEYMPNMQVKAAIASTRSASRPECFGFESRLQPRMHRKRAMKRSTARVRGVSTAVGEESEERRGERRGGGAEGRAEQRGAPSMLRPVDAYDGF